MFCALGSLSAFAQQQQTIDWSAWAGVQDMDGMVIDWNDPDQAVTFYGSDEYDLPDLPTHTEQGLELQYTTSNSYVITVEENSGKKRFAFGESNNPQSPITITITASGDSQFKVTKKMSVYYVEYTAEITSVIGHYGQTFGDIQIKASVLENGTNKTVKGTWRIENVSETEVLTESTTVSDLSFKFTPTGRYYFTDFNSNTTACTVIHDIQVTNKPVLTLYTQDERGVNVEIQNGKELRTIDELLVIVQSTLNIDGMSIVWNVSPETLAEKSQDGKSVMFNGAGVVTITASQNEGSQVVDGVTYNYQAADIVTKTITVRKTKLSGTLDQAGQNVQIARGSALSTITLTGAVVDEDGDAVTDGHWEFVDPTIVPTANGSYKVKYVVGNTDKYESTIAEQTVNVLIEPMDLHGGELEQTEFTLLEGQTLEDITLAIKTNPQDEQNQSISGTVAFSADAPSLQLGKNSYDVIFTPAANADWYNLPYKFPTQVTITVNKPVQTITWEGGNATETIRTIDEDKISATSNQGAAISYSANAAFLQIEGGAIKDICKAGTVTVTATAAEIKVGKVTYPSITATKTFTINKTDIDHIDDLGTLSYTYGETLASKNITTNGYTPAPQETVAGTIVFDEPNAVPQAGESTANATFTPTKSEKFNAYKTTVNIIVGKAVQTVVGMPVSVLTAERFVLPEKTEQGAVLSYTSSNTSVVEINVDRSLNIHQAGTATITATAPVTADGNYAEFNQPYSLEVKLTPASIENIVATEIHADDTWGTTTVTGTLVASVPDKGINISQNLTGEFYVYDAAGKDDTPGTPGDYTVQVAFTITPANFYQVTNILSTQIEVTGKTNNITWTPTEENIKTTDVIFATSTAGGSVTYALDPAEVEKGVVKIEGDAVTIIKAGTVTIKASQDKTGEYDAAAEVAKTYTIAKTDVTITEAPTLSKIELTYGEALSTITLSGGVAKVGETVIEGTWSIENATQILPAKEGEPQSITLLFTPDNTNWYNTATTTATVTVGKAMQTIDLSGLSSKYYTVQSDTLPKISSAGNEVNYTFSPDDVVVLEDDVVGYILTFKKAGNVTVTATAVGNNHNPATEMHSLSVEKTPVYITNVKTTPLYQGDAWKKAQVIGTLASGYRNGWGNVSQLEGGVVFEQVLTNGRVIEFALNPSGNDDYTVVIPEDLQVPVSDVQVTYDIKYKFTIDGEIFTSSEISGGGYSYDKAQLTVYPFAPSDIIASFPTKDDIKEVDENATYRQLLYFDVNTTVTGADKTHANLTQPVSVTDEQYFFKSSKAKEWMMFTPPFDISEIYVIDVTGDNATALYNHLVDEVAKVPASQTEEGTTAATTLDVLNLIKTQTNNELYPITSVDHFLLYESEDTWAYKGGDALEASWTRVKDSKMHQGKVYSMFFPLEYFNDKLLLFVGKNWTQIGTSLQNETAATAAASVRGNSTLKNQELGGNEWVYKATYTPTEGGETLTSVFYAHKVTADDDAIISPSEVYLVPQDIQKARTGGEMYAPRRVQSDSHYLQAVGVTREGTLIWEPMENESTTDIENITGATLNLITETAGFSIISATTQEVVIYSTTGRLVFQGTIDAELRMHFPVPAGIYIVKTPKETHKVIAK